MTPLLDYRVADSPCSLIITPLVASFGHGDNGGWELKITTGKTRLPRIGIEPATT